MRHQIASLLVPVFSVPALGQTALTQQQPATSFIRRGSENRGSSTVATARSEHLLADGNQPTSLGDLARLHARKKDEPKAVKVIDDGCPPRRNPHR
jgi:hypothetical protein